MLFLHFVTLHCITDHRCDGQGGLRTVSNNSNNDSNDNSNNTNHTDNDNDTDNILANIIVTRHVYHAQSMLIIVIAIIHTSNLVKSYQNGVSLSHMTGRFARDILLLFSFAQS